MTNCVLNNLPRLPSMFCFLVTLLLGLTCTARGHPISLSSAIVDVHEDHIVADLQIMLEDLVLYQQLTADAEQRYTAAALREAAAKHSEFVQRYFTILDADGLPLTSECKEIDTKQLEEKGAHQTELMKNAVRYVLSFAVPKPQSFLTFMQSFGGVDSVLPAVMDLMLLQNGVMIKRPMQLSRGRPHTAKFDWTNPPAGKVNTLGMLRKKRAQLLRERLGIATYGGLYSFLYITRFEVRHEILIPLLTLEKWLPIERATPDFLEVEEQEAVRDELETFFQKRAPVVLNSVTVAPTLTRLNFFGLDINDFALNAEPRRTSVFQARVGIILSYPSEETPNQITMGWELFSEHAPYLRTVVLVGNEKPDSFLFRVGRAKFKWQGELVGTRVTPVPADTSALDPIVAKDVLRNLLINIYRAFDFRHDSDVYDALATSVNGDLLRDLYLQVKRSLLVAEQGGALSHVSVVEVLDVKPAERSNASFDCTWQVTGTVEHWGHVHTRVSEYAAGLTFGRDEGAWKLTGVKLLNEKRIKFETRVRGFTQDK